MPASSASAPSGARSTRSSILRFIGPIWSSKLEPFAARLANTKPRYSPTRGAREAERRLVEIGGAALWYRHRGEAAVGVEAPAVIATGQPRGVALALVDHLGAAVGAAVEQHVGAAVAVADHDHGLAAELGSDVVANVRHLALVADEQPGAAENALHLEFEQLGIGVDATMHTTGLDQPGDLVSVAHAVFSK